jgi:hypothetical protein
VLTFDVNRRGRLLKSIFRGGNVVSAGLQICEFVHPSGISDGEKFRPFVHVVRDNPDFRHRFAARGFAGHTAYVTIRHLPECWKCEQSEQKCDTDRRSHGRSIAAQVCECVIFAKTKDKMPDS